MTTASGCGDRETRPRLAPHVRLSFDSRRRRWVLMAPERVFVPDEIALEVLRRCTGNASLAEIADDLAREFDASREEIARDVAHARAERQGGARLLMVEAPFAVTHAYARCGAGSEVLGRVPSLDCV